jgi:hypothetical protein
MSTVLKWFGDQARAYVRRRTINGLQKLAYAVETRARMLLSVQGSPTDRSHPGEPPRRQTGELQAGVYSQVDEESLSAFVGTDVPHGIYMELGTKRGILPRPWLRPALAWGASKVYGFFGNGTGE